MKYKTLKLRRLRLQKLAAHRRRQKQRCFTIILFAALFLLAWCVGPNL
jgi:hypothetical protein